MCIELGINYHSDKEIDSDEYRLNKIYQIK